MKHIMKNLLKKYSKTIESKECFGKQYEIICACVKRAINEWIKENPQLQERYSLDAFSYLDIGIANDINYEIIHNIPYNQKTIALSIWHECIDSAFDTYETFDEDFSIEVCLKVAGSILSYLSELLPETKRFVLPPYLQEFSEKYCIHCGKELTKKADKFLKCEKCRILKPIRNDESIIILNKNHTTIKCWSEYLPELANAGPKIMSANIESTGNDFYLHKKIVLEYSSAMHASSYGLLGFEYIQETSLNCLEIEVRYIDDRPFDKERCSKYFEEKIADGIEKQFAKAILDEALKQFKEREVIPSGKFIFCKGRTGEVRSSPKRFEFLVKMLIDIFYAKEQIDEIKLLELKELAEEYKN